MIRLIYYGQCSNTDPGGRAGYCVAPTDNDTLLKDFNYFVWSANKELATVSNTAITVNRNVNTATSNAAPYPYGTWEWSGEAKRYIFTWNDLDNDGIVDESSTAAEHEIIPLTSATNWASLDTNSGYPRGTIFNDFMIEDADYDGDSDIDNADRELELDNFVDWLRGFDDLLGAMVTMHYRCRKYPFCYDSASGLPAIGNGSDPVWRLGDIIHSTPKLVAKPAEAFHTIYADPTYAYFLKRHFYRRHMIYAGGNDGMLHAINGGFYDAATDGFYTNFDPSQTQPYSDDSGPPLGFEMWAYVPYNLQPHLNCLADKDAGDRHKYYVDKEPRIFDMQIFQEESACLIDVYDEDCIHPRGWGTVLVGAMRFGGSPITAADDPNWPADDNRKFISSYFVMDITDPERPPRSTG